MVKDRWTVQSAGWPKQEVLRRLMFVALDLALLPKIFSEVVEQATDGPRKGFNPPPALR
jgi:hypothetical protein